MNLLDRLKADTADLHAQVELRVPVFQPDFELEGYRKLLARFYGYWTPLEAELASIEELDGPPLHFSSRLKAHLLEADLRSLDVDPRALPHCTALPDVRSFARASGCLYVLEGSTLGSQFIARKLKQRFDFDYGNGAAYFNAYQDRTGARWAEFRSFINAHAAQLPPDQTVAAARETFATLNAWLAAIL